jgi:hypothetical protein
MSGFLGDGANNIVHDLANKKTKCKIYRIEMKNRIYFTPDTLDNAKSKNFVPCEFCFIS